VVQEGQEAEEEDIAADNPAKTSLATVVDIAAIALGVLVKIEEIEWTIVIEH
jgi:hypothetical protein